MSKFYNLDIIPRILKYFKIKDIIVSGVKDENLINCIINYGAKCTFINTPQINNFDVVNGNSLEILSNLSNYDAIFIDDDPNWYTIFSELTIIKKTNDTFPLVFVCNNKFPNKRRDSYSNFNSIPKKFRQKYTKELPIYYNNEKITIFDGFYHACDENTPKNGVLTGIEDILIDNSHIGMMKINFIEGITILYGRLSVNQKRIEIIYNDIANFELKDFDMSGKLVENELLFSYINKNLNDYELEISNKDGIINDYEDKVRNYKIELDSKINGFENKLNLKDTQIKNFESKLINKDKTIVYLESKIQNNNNQLKSKQEELAEKGELINHLNMQRINHLSKINREEYCISCFKEEISNNNLEISYLKNTTFTKKILSPLSYLYLIFKSNPDEISINFKLFKALKNSKCFDIGFYLNNNKDLVESNWCKYFSPELHYVCKGFDEKRTFNKKYFNRNSKKELLEYLLTCDM